jgi:hypothetical protein
MLRYRRRGVAMTDREWLDAFARRLGVRAPSDDEHELILQLAAEAAHASERTAAPAACWLAAAAGRDLTEALEAAREVGGSTSR